MKKIFLLIALFISLASFSQVRKMDAAAYKEVTTTQRDSLTVPSGEHWTIYNITNDRYEYWDGSAWQALVSGGAGTGDMTKAVYDPTGINASAFDYTNFINTPTNVSSFTNDSGYLTSVGISDLTATGTPSATTYLRGDNTWGTITASAITFLDEGNGVGYVVNGRDVNTAGNIGYKAFEVSTGTSNSHGATGDYSFTSGFGTAASGLYATAMGDYTTASGWHSFSGNINNYARSFGETALGTYGTDYTPSAVGNFIASDRLFNFGNGVDASNRSDAITGLKNGQIGIGINNFEANTTGEKLQVNGTVKATAFVGDGSGLTGITGTTPSLQDVSDVGNTTTNYLNVNNGSLLNGVGVRFYNTIGGESSLSLSTDGTDSSGSLYLANSSGGERIIGMSNTNADSNLWTYPNRTNGSNTFFVASISDGGTPITADGTGNIDISSLLAGGGTYTDEQAQDAVGGILSTNFSYNDAGNSIDLSSGVLASLGLADSALQPSDIDTFAELNTIVADKTLANLEDAQTFTGYKTFTDKIIINGSALDFASLESSNGNLIVGNDTQDNLFYFGESFLTPGQYMISGSPGNSVSLFYNGVEKLKTTSTGVEVPDATTSNQAVNKGQLDSADFAKVYPDSPVKPEIWSGNLTQYYTKFGHGYTHPTSDLIFISDSIPPATTATDIVYDNATSGLAAAQVQAAIDEIEARVDINDAKTSNANHTGDVTGSTTLTIDPTAISGKTSATLAGTEEVLVNDAGTLKKTTTQAIADLGGGSSSTTQEAVLTVTNPTIASGVYSQQIIAAPGVGKQIVIESFNYVAVGGAASTGTTSGVLRYNGSTTNLTDNLNVMVTSGLTYSRNGLQGVVIINDQSNKAINFTLLNTTDQTLTVTIFVKVKYSICDTTTGF